MPKNNARPVHSLAEMANAFRDQLRSVLGVRLGYYLLRIPTDEDFGRLRLELSDDGEQMRYYYGSECLLHVDTSDTEHVRLSAWDMITEAEVNGSAPGPPAFHGQDTSILQKIGEPSSYIVMRPPEKKRKR